MQNKIKKSKIKIILKILFLFFIFFVNSYAVIEKNPENKGNIEELNKDDKIKKEEKGTIDISLKFNKYEFDIDDIIELEILIKSKNKEILGNLEIDGIDDFELISNLKTRNFSSDSFGNILGELKIKIALKAHKSGDFFIGPVKFNGKEKTKKYKIKITGERLFIGNNQNPGLFFNNKNDNLLESETAKLQENIKKNKKEKKVEIKKENIQKKETKKIDISDMKTIYLNKNKLYPDLFSLESFYFIFFIIFLYFLYKIVDKYLILKIEKIEEKRFIRKNKKIDFYKLISDLQSKVGDYKKEVFYAKIGDIYRMFLDEKYPKQLSSKSLKELESILNPKYFLIYKKIYYPEYSPYSDSLQERLKILEELKEIFN